MLDAGVLAVGVLPRVTEAASAATRAGMVSMMSCVTRSACSHWMSPKCSLNVRRMFESRSSSGSPR